MKRFSLLLFAAFSLSAQTTSLTLNLTFPTGVFQDIMTHWTDQRQGFPVGTVGSAIGSGDASITLAAPVTLASGVTILVVDASGSVEPMSVSAPVSNSATVPVTRAFPGFTAAAHNTGVNVYQLTYANPLKMMSAEVLQVWANNIVVQLAQQNRSAQIPPLSGTFAISQ